MCKIYFYHLHQPQGLESNEGISVVLNVVVTDTEIILLHRIVMK
jgi:hypothetical protein